MADTVRGDGLFIAERALAALVENPERLDRARGRFSESPPSYRSHLSGTPTRSQSPNPPSEEEQRREDRRFQLALEYMASRPYNQFLSQIIEEGNQIIKANRNGGRRIPDYQTLAEENVKKRWVEQGIWNNKWNSRASGRWKHEEPLELESESETSSETEPKISIFSLPSKEAGPKLRRPKSDEERRQISERLVREREASRPFHQFFYQVSKDRERIREESGVEEATVMDSADINTMAYENVKSIWTKRGIWNRKWGILPGMSWKHEQPFEEMLDDYPAIIQANPREDDHNGTREAHPRRIFGSPFPSESNHNQVPDIMNVSQQELPAAIEQPFEEMLDDDPAIIQANPREDDRNGVREAHPRRIFGSPFSAESNHNQAPDVMNVSQQELPAAIEPAGLQNGYANHSPSALSPRQRTESRQDPCSAAGQRPRPRGRAPSSEDGRARPATRTSLGPVRSSRGSKALRKKGPGPRRRPNPSESDAQQPLPGLDIPEPPFFQITPVPPRRSRRLQRAEPSVAADPAEITSADLLNGASQPRPRGIMGSPKSAGLVKPRGISKRQRPRTTRRRARPDD